MDFTLESNLLGHKLISDILLSSSATLNVSTSGAGHSFDSTPKISSIWQTSGTSQPKSLINPNYSLNNPSLFLNLENSYNSPFTRNSSTSRKNSMNVNAPSYVPVGSNTGNYTIDSGFNQNIESKNYTYQQPQPQNNHQLQYQSMQLDNFPIKLQESLVNVPKNMNFDNGVSDGEYDNIKQYIQKLEVDLELRNLMIENLVEQISTSNSIETLENSREGSIRIPTNYLQLFETLNKKYKEKNEELEQTKERLESIITAIAMNPQRSRTFNGYYDEEEISHRIISKLTVLDTENENLLKIFSSSNKSSLIVEIGLLRAENNKLKAMVAEGTK